VSEDKLRKDVVRGNEADGLLKSEVFNHGISQIREGLINKWMLTTDAMERDRIWMSVNLLEKITAALVVCVGDGRIAQAEIDAIVAVPKAA